MVEKKITIEELKSQIKSYDEYDDFKGAYGAYKELKKYLDESDLRFSNPESFKQFFNLLTKLKFLSLNYFDNWEEIGDLISKHLDKVFELEHFDLWNKIETNLLSTDDMDERDEIKKGLIKKLSESDKVIINKIGYPQKSNLPLTIADWIKDININVGYKNTSSFEKTKYLTNSSNIIVLKNEDKRKIKILFDLYEKLKLSSKTPQGYEDDVPIEIDGELYIFRRGMMEPLKNILKYTKDLSGPPKTQEEKKIDELKERLPQEEGFGKMASEEGISDTQKIDELKIMANRYKDNSLQRRAIEEEIRKLERK